MYTKPKPMGDTTTDTASTGTTLSGIMNSPSVSTGSAMALTYHGYRRTRSVVWGLIYGMLGYWKPVVMVPIALAQGYGERKPCP